MRTQVSPKQRLSHQLKQLRAKAGWSQSGAAVSIGISRAAYSSYEEARAFPMLHVLARMAEVYKCTIDHLLQRETK